MKNSKELIKQAGILPPLRLAVDKGQGGKKNIQSTGPHKVRLGSDTLGRGRDYKTGKEIAIVKLVVEENGEKKQYDFPVKDEQGNLHYLVLRLAEFSEGEEVIMEYKHKGVRGYISVTRPGEEEERDVLADVEVPTVNYEDVQ